MKNTTFIIFGATGDLTKRKLIPALYRFIAKERLKNFIIVGAAFSDVTAEQMLQPAREFVQGLDEEVWAVLQEHTYNKKINFTDEHDFVALNAFVQECERVQGFTENNRLFYLATGSHFFCPITSHIAQSGLAQRQSQKGGAVWQRLVYEKPFGHDGASAHAINECIAQWFDESQIYRIDHYLTKEIVGNIAMIRFTNCVLEPLWSNRYIDQVQIVLSESVGIDLRGLYYDSYGALRDVVQNHMLELLALVCMEAPEKLTGDFIRSERAKVLEKVRFVDGILGQYDGYLSEQDVDKNSRTDTFASLQFAVDNPRWAGVPFYLKTGKCLDKKETVINIKFKQVDCLLLRGCPTESNWLTIRIDPESSIILTLNAKSPESTDQIIPVGMEFCHSCIFGLQTPQAYEVILEEVMRGEQSIVVRCDEIEYAWKVIDAIRAQNLPLYTYAKGSIGPKQEEQLAQKQGMRWRL